MEVPGAARRSVQDDAQGRHARRRLGAAGAPAFQLPPEILAAVLSHLPLEQQLEVATVSQAFSEAVRCNVRGVVVELGQKSRVAVPARLLEQLTAVSRVALLTPTATAAGPAATAAAQAARWDPEEHRLWCPEAGTRLPAAGAHLRRLGAAFDRRSTQPPAARGCCRSLTLLLAAPEMDASASQLHRMLVHAGGKEQFAAVSVPQGLLRLDGALAAQLVWCNTRAGALPSVLQAPTCYASLERLALKVSPEDDLAASLGCINARTLPALRFLALLAPATAGAAADLGALVHAGLRHLHLHGLQLPAGFSSLQQLTGLHSLAVRYDEEDEPPPLNLQGDLAALSTLCQLSELSVDALATGEGLSTLTQLTALSLAPQQGARIGLRGLPLLRRLAVDLSAGSCGHDLLSEARSSVHVPVAAHGLDSLQQIELRCFVWRHWEAAGSRADDEEAGSEGGSSGAGSSEAAVEEVEEEESGSDSDGASSASSADDSSSIDSWQEQLEEEEELLSQAGSELTEAADQDEVMWEAAEAEQEEEEEVEEEEEAQQAGLLEASWGFLHTRQCDHCTTQEPQCAMASLENRYIAALLARLPTLATIQLTDYMGLVDQPALMANQGGKPGQAAASPAAAPVGTGKDAVGASSRAGTPGLLGDVAASGATSSLPGWQRVVAETPVPGGISQYDITYTRSP